MEAMKIQATDKFLIEGSLVRYYDSPCKLNKLTLETGSVQCMDSQQVMNHSPTERK